MKLTFGGSAASGGMDGNLTLNGVHLGKTELDMTHGLAARSIALFLAVTACTVLGNLPTRAVAETAAPDAVSERASRTLHRRAVEAVIWGMPMVSFDAMRQAYLRDAGAAYNDIIWWPKGSGWKNQSLTVNTSVRYLYFFTNTKVDGPVVIEIPEAVPGASFYGTIEDAWFLPLVDVGFQGKGGKYLLLPPGHTEPVPPGYTVLTPQTYNSMTLLRSIVASNSPEDVAAANALVEKVRIYPLSEAENPPDQRLIDMTDILYSGLVTYDWRFYESLARTLDEEPVQDTDAQMLGILRAVGIRRGQPFEPDAATKAALDVAAAEAKDWVIGERPQFITSIWEGSQWAVPAGPVTVETNSTWRTPDYFDVDSRALSLGSFFAPTAVLGSGSFYFGTYKDSQGEGLSGDRTYRLQVPPNVPVRDFWAFTVYDQETAALFRESPRPTIDSLDETLERNPDGSVDIYIGPEAPAGKESNWIYTPPGSAWFPWFRAYGPEAALMDGSWVLPDIERLE